MAEERLVCAEEINGKAQLGKNFAKKKGLTHSAAALRYSLIASIGSAMSGYCGGVISGAVLFIREDLSLSEIQQEILIGSLLLVSIIGGLLAGLIADTIGRKKTVMVGGIIVMVGSWLMGLAPSYLILLSGRLVTGIGYGFPLAIVPVYIAEISPAPSRGKLLSIPEIFLNSGILLGYVSSFCLAPLPVFINWRIMLGLGGVLGLLLACCALFIPESPRWLVMKEREDEAFAILLRVFDDQREAEIRLRRIMITPHDYHPHTDTGTHTLTHTGTVTDTETRSEQFGSKQKPPVLHKKGATTDTDTAPQSVMFGSNQILHNKGVKTDPETDTDTDRQSVGFGAKQKQCVLHCTGAKTETAIAVNTPLLPHHDHQLEDAWMELLKPHKEVRGALIAALGLQIFQQTSGINAILYYLPFIFQKANVHTTAGSLGATVTVGVVKTAFILVATNFLDKSGRRPLLFISALGMAASMATLATGFYLVEWMSTSQVGVPANLPGILALCSTCSFVAFFSTGWGPITTLVPSEVFPLRLRAQGLSLSLATNRLVGGLMSLSFLTIMAVVTPAGVFYMFAGICTLSLLFVYFSIPETKGKTLEEINT